MKLWQFFFCLLIKWRRKWSFCVSRWTWAAISSTTLGDCGPLPSDEFKVSECFNWGKLILLLFFWCLCLLGFFFLWQGNTRRCYHWLSDCGVFGFQAFLRCRQLAESLWPRFDRCHHSHCLYHCRLLPAFDVNLMKYKELSSYWTCVEGESTERIILICRIWNVYVVPFYLALSS